MNFSFLHNKLVLRGGLVAGSRIQFSPVWSKLCFMSGVVPRYRSPGEISHPNKKRNLYPPQARSGRGDQIRVQNHSHLAAEKVEQDRDPFAFGHPFE
jgi:hypothetical protein